MLHLELVIGSQRTRAQPLATADASAPRVLILNFPFLGTPTHPFLECMRDWSSQVQRLDPNQADRGPGWGAPLSEVPAPRS